MTSFILRQTSERSMRSFSRHDNESSWHPHQQRKQPRHFALSSTLTAS
ncbi:hypothetical protein TSMEX_000115 [Taenia solium]|eukprot:TsM_000375300 transcript=TsM_000375300 gene=TsM_000375300